MQYKKAYEMAQDKAASSGPNRAQEEAVKLLNPKYRVVSLLICVFSSLSF